MKQVSDELSESLKQGIQVGNQKRKIKTVSEEVVLSPVLKPKSGIGVAIKIAPLALQGHDYINLKAS